MRHMMNVPIFMPPFEKEGAYCFAQLSVGMSVFAKLVLKFFMMILCHLHLEEQLKFVRRLCPVVTL